MDEGENQCKNILKDLHFKAVNARSEVLTDEKKELLRRPKFIVVPAQLPTSASQCDTDESSGTNDKRLSSSATSPASIGLPAVITPTRPSMCTKINSHMKDKCFFEIQKNISIFGQLQNIIWLTMS